MYNNYNVSITEKSFKGLYNAKTLGLIDSYRKFTSRAILNELARMNDKDMELLEVEKAEYKAFIKRGFKPVIVDFEVVAWVQ